MISGRLRLLAACTLALSSMFGYGLGNAFAHAQYDGSTPSANGTVSNAPNAVQIAFSQELSDVKISITGPRGAEVTTAPATFNLENRHQAHVSMKDDGPGTYTVLWHNVSGDDGDPNDGQFLFTVTVTGAAPTTAATTTSTSATQATTTAEPSAPAQASAAPACVDNGVRTPGITDSRVDTFCKREAIRQKYAGQIDVATFNAALADGQGLESALADAMADFQSEQTQKTH